MITQRLPMGAGVGASRAYIAVARAIAGYAAPTSAVVSPHPAAALPSPAVLLAIRAGVQEALAAGLATSVVGITTAVLRVASTPASSTLPPMACAHFCMGERLGVVWFYGVLSGGQGWLAVCLLHPAICQMVIQ